MTGDVSLHTFLTSVLNRSQWPASCSGRFTNGQGSWGSDLIWVWESGRAALDVVANKRNPCPCYVRTPVVQPKASLYWLSYPGEDLHFILNFCKYM